MEIIDTHCHINDDAFTDDLQTVIHNAHIQDVKQMIVIGVDKISGLRALEIAEKNEGIFVAIAWHPVDVIDCTDADKQWLQEVWSHPKVVAVGETGLDYHWDKSPKEQQKEFFVWHLEEAIQRSLPFIIHNRDAHADTLTILKEMYQKYGELKGIMHSYSGSVEMAREFLKLGLHLSISGVVTFKNAKNVKEVVPIIPDNKILVETDAPYLTPSPYRGKRNEPAYTRLTAQEVAKLRGISLEAVATLTTNNAKALFNI